MIRSPGSYFSDDVVMGLRAVLPPRQEVYSHVSSLL